MIGMPQGSPSGAIAGGIRSETILRMMVTAVPEMIEASPPALVARFQARAAMRAGVMATP